jgi:hypothetical protein
VETFINVEENYVNFDVELLIRWKQRDISVVPQYALDWKGNGVSNGYGFGEWFVEQYFNNNGFKVIRNDFNIISKKSKFKENNQVIASIFGDERVLSFGNVARRFYQNGLKIENVDLFVFNDYTSYFVEVKKGKDQLREPQLRFMYLAKEILNCDSKVFFLNESSGVERIETKSYHLSIEL